MKKFFASFLILGFLLSFDSPALAHDRSRTTDAVLPDISVWVYNYAQVPRQTLEQAERDVARIYRDAGIEVAWRNCNTELTGIPQGVDCTESTKPTELILRILPEIAVVPGVTHDSTMGFAIGNLASLSFCQVKAEAAKFGVRPYAVLGPAIAHEIGHLLLGQQGHSPTGIMRAIWGRRDYEAPPLGAFKFTAEQAEQVRAEVRERGRQQAATAPSLSAESHGPRS